MRFVAINHNNITLKSTIKEIVTFYFSDSTISYKSDLNFTANPIGSAFLYLLCFQKRCLVGTMAGLISGTSHPTISNYSGKFILLFSDSSEEFVLKSSKYCKL